MGLYLSILAILITLYSAGYLVSCLHVSTHNRQLNDSFEKAEEKQKFK